VPVEKLTPERRRQLTRDALLDAAEEVFARRGAGAAAIEEIAAEAGFSRGAIYDHFGSKDELLLAVMERLSARQFAEYEHVADPDQPVEAAHSAAKVFQANHSLELMPLELELRANALRNPELRRRLVESDRANGAAAAALVTQMLGGTKGLRIPPEDLADIGRAALVGLLMYAATDEERRERYEGLVETMFVLLTEAID